MIIVKLMGGLGNQMFQYAAARRLAHVHSAHLKLDLSWFDNIAVSETPRSYGLHVFAIRADIAETEELNRFGMTGAGALKKVLAKLLHPLSPWTCIRERHFHFDPRVLNAPDNTYLNGSWQSEKYFRDIESIIREEFTFRNAPDPLNMEMAEEIRGTNSISVHVRRGDYVSNALAREVLGTSSMDYYHKAVEKIAAAVINPKFFLFTDDIEWANNNFDIGFPITMVTQNNNENSHEDLRLMTLCKHNIIANSSFSWWGAWLNTNQNKIVIACKNWFRSQNYDTRDLLPERWILL